MSNHGLVIVTQPTEEPLTIAEVCSHLRHPDAVDEEAEYYDRLIRTAREWVENELHRQLVTATWDYFTDDFPRGGRVPIEVPRPPLQSVTSVKYYDGNGTQQTWSSANYVVDSKTEPGRIEPIESQSWPSWQDRVNSITVRFVCGYGAASAVPDCIKHAMLFLIAHWDCDRESMGEIPMGAQRLLDPERFTMYV